MDPQTIFLPAPPRIRRKRRGGAPASAPVAPLTLVSAAYDEVALTVTLTFDRAIDVAGLDGTAVVVEDGNFTLGRYEATGAVTILAPAQVRVGLVLVGTFADPAVLLNAAADNGIVAADDGGAWAGESGLELPFP